MSGILLLYTHFKCKTFLFDQYIGTYQVLLHRVRVNLGAVEMKEVLHFSQNSRTGTSASDCLMSYPGYLLGGEEFYQSVVMQLVNSTAPVYWARCGCVNSIIWMYHMDACKNHREEARRGQHKNEKCSFEQMLETTFRKRIVVQLPISHLNNHHSKTRCPWCNGYRRRKWIRRHEFKSWTRLIAFHIALIPLGKVWIQLISL